MRRSELLSGIGKKPQVPAMLRLARKGDAHDSVLSARASAAKSRPHMHAAAAAAAHFSPKSSFDSLLTRTNVVRLVSSFSVRAPT
jgi:hypothetical protein